MRGGSGASQYRNGAQAGAMQRQMMQNQYRMRQSGMGNQMGYGQQQRLRDGSCGGQGSGGAMDATQMYMMQMMQQQRMRQGQTGGNGQGAAHGKGRGGSR